MFLSIREPKNQSSFIWRRPRRSPYLFFEPIRDPTISFLPTQEKFHRERERDPERKKKWNAGHWVSCWDYLLHWWHWFYHWWAQLSGFLGEFSLFLLSFSYCFFFFFYAFAIFSAVFPFWFSIFFPIQYSSLLISYRVKKHWLKVQPLIKRKREKRKHDPIDKTNRFRFLHRSILWYVLIFHFVPLPLYICLK